jgi:hypothetical protein
MKTVIVYLAAVGVASGYGLWAAASDALPANLAPFRLAVQCALMGSVGGVIYCLRGVYLSRSVRDDWDDRWITWYLIRPWVSLMVGAVSFVFLEAGLLVLEAEQEATAGELGFLAFAFVAGLNVDGMLKRIEALAEGQWGVDPSRAGRQDDGADEDN